jgi:hypothetical protein
MSQNESAARFQCRHTRTARLKVLAARPALITLTAAGMIARQISWPTRNSLALVSTSSRGAPSSLEMTASAPRP